MGSNARFQKASIFFGACQEEHDPKAGVRTGFKRERWLLSYQWFGGHWLLTALNCIYGGAILADETGFNDLRLAMRTK